LKIAFVVFNGLTTLDFIGIYDPLTRLKTMGFMPDLVWDLCAYTDIVKDDRGLILVPTAIQEPLESYDMLVVPGGYGTRNLIHDRNFVEWIRTAEPCRWKVSVCTGALLLGAAGFLKGKRATTHPSAIPELQPFCRTVLKNRIVDEGDILSAGGVSSGIDLGLYVAGKLAGGEARLKIARQMDYPYSLREEDIAR